MAELYKGEALNRIEEEIMSINRDLEEGNRNGIAGSASNRNYSSVSHMISQSAQRHSQSQTR